MPIYDLGLERASDPSEALAAVSSSQLIRSFVLSAKHIPCLCSSSNTRQEYVQQRDRFLFSPTVGFCCTKAIFLNKSRRFGFGKNIRSLDRGTCSSEGGSSSHLLWVFAAQVCLPGWAGGQRRSGSGGWPPPGLGC